MDRFFVLTFVGEDRPGLVESLARVVAGRNGNWLESRMTRLQGKFAGISRISVDERQVTSLRRDLGGLEGNGFSITIDELEQVEPSGLQQLRLSIVGPDRPGVVHEITRALSPLGVNVVEMTTNVEHAAMTALLMFSADARIEVPADIDVDALDADLDSIAARLGVEVHLAEVGGD